VPTEFVHWVLAQNRHRVTCSIRPSESGRHVAIVCFDGLPVRRRECERSNEAFDWSAAVCAAWQTYGWRPATE
jgi:hypothetical protein